MKMYNTQNTVFGTRASHRILATLSNFNLRRLIQKFIFWRLEVYIKYGHLFFNNKSLLK